MLSISAQTVNVEVFPPEEVFLQSVNKNIRICAPPPNYRSSAPEIWRVASGKRPFQRPPKPREKIWKGL